MGIWDSAGRTEPDDIQVERDEIRERWKHEDELINQRTTWLLGTQSVLLAGFAAVFALANDAENLTDGLLRLAVLVGIPIVGLLIALPIRAGLRAAQNAMAVLARSSARTEYLRDLGLLGVANSDLEIPRLRKEVVGRFEAAWAVALGMPEPADGSARASTAEGGTVVHEAANFGSGPKGRILLPGLNRLAAELARREEAACHGQPDGVVSQCEGAKACEPSTGARGTCSAIKQTAEWFPDGHGVEWPYWRPDVSSDTSRGGLTAFLGLSNVVIWTWVGLAIVGAAAGVAGFPNC